MTIPSGTDEVWKDLLLKKKSYDFEFLALKNAAWKTYHGN